MKLSLKTGIIAGILTIVITFTGYHSLAGHSLSTERHEWYFEKRGGEQPPVTDRKFYSLMEKYGTIFIGDTSKKEIYLTFDNGYENGYTDDVLNVLREKKVPAAFFVTGQFMKTDPDLIKRMADEGHIVGNHTFHHPDMTSISKERLKTELQKVKSRYQEITGKSEMMYVRPPKGVFSENSVAFSKEQGYTHVFWSLAFPDWDTNRQRGWQYSYNQIMKQIHPGAILLLHTVSKDNSDALSKVIDDVRKRGYQFKSLDELAASQQTPAIFISP
ncbi:delta-lactam-biosynthetic de-N-acetylase [Fictibacillus iocasae]|uniref:Delta-lactam-biosynthetic de-N-acetylase n=1 Tax=Fictibacillus iocasae TaxID=2715437 RepID=A0ABW2NT07_9BACL